ncbi:hypothetical protein [uncultured Piscinibacter sp.]|uniref:hypothetical protein n=1 Tax=uncultured Piscinibacter sp. TaxID=1131835 RepID=UPI0026103669|nr:hypothetical protein [uncultured Piscinibacter sp.]
MGLPAASFEFRTARAWRRSVLTLSASGLLLTALWLSALHSRDELAPAPWAVPAVLACLLAASAARTRKGRLRWDGQGWHLSESAPREVPESPGSLQLAFDGGAWMLLRFRKTESSRWWLSGTWLALAGIEFSGDWHALRCAVYSPRPDPAGLSAQAPADPPA